MTGSRLQTEHELRQYHTRAASLLTIAIVALLLALPISQDVQLVGLVGIVALLGVPHGALDHLAGAHLFKPRFGKIWLPVFLAAYLSLSAAVIAVWVRWPLIGLLGFLAVAVMHFGSEDAHDPAEHVEDGPGVSTRPSWAHHLEVLTRGALPIVVPCVAHPSAVGEIFDLLGLLGSGMDGATLARAIGSLWPVLPLAIAPALALAARRAFRHGSIQPFSRLAEIPLLAAALVSLPPLVGFVVYFVGWHSVRHTLTWVVRLEPSNPKRGFMRFARLALPLTVATAMLGALAWTLLPGSMNERALQVVFVGLAALTIPHVMLEVAVESSS